MTKLTKLYNWIEGEKKKPEKMKVIQTSIGKSWTEDYESEALKAHNQALTKVQEKIKEMEDK